MRFTHSIVILSAALFAPVLSGEAVADLSWDTVTTTVVSYDGAEKEVFRKEESYTWKSNVIRIDDPAQNTAAFYNFQNNAAVFVNFKSRTFLTTTIGQVIRESRAERSRIRSELPARARALEEMEGEEKEIMAAQLEGQKTSFELWSAGRAYRIEPSEEREKIAGHRCRKYIGYSGEVRFQEIWVAEDIDPGIEWNRYLGRGMAGLDPLEFSYMQYVNSLPMKVVTKYGPVTVTKEVVHLSDAAAPAEAFLLPQDLTKTAMAK